MQSNPVTDLEAKYWQLLECADKRASEQLLKEVRSSNSEMAAELEKMLDAQGKLGGFLEPINDREPSSYGDHAATVDSHFANDRAPMQAPDIIGPYKLLEPIGEGGMGVVYLAQQSKPVRRKVALKIIKPGMDSRQVIARFEAERQALAMMEHPNIAKVLDAGTMESGVPYFVMELVRGIPITEYCNRAKLNTRQRLELFCHACQAMQHAHNKGIIHRDIKPNNVLVTEHDGTPVVKVIDFGVAKALTDNLTDKTLYTGMFQMIGTPLYMSPEQASLSNLDVDTRSDVYSLGVLLYELLSGTLPIDRASIKEMSFDQLREHICDTEPLSPSKRLSTLRDQRETVTERRGIERDQLARSLRGELDWIVMKAIEKDRNRRYQSPRELAEDVQRHLVGEAVRACPPSFSYKLVKSYRRHRVLFWSAASLLLVLLAGVAGTGWQAFRATIAEQDSAFRLESLQTEQSRTKQALSKAEAAELEQRRLREEAERSDRASKWSLYVANLYPMRAAWESQDFGKLGSLLDASVPKPGEPDYRGWEWYYLKSQAEARFRTVRFGEHVANGPIAWCDATRQLATASGNREVIVWNTETQEKTGRVGIESNISAMQFSPDGEILAVGLEDGTLCLVEVATCRLQSLDPISVGQPSQDIRAISWNPDGARVAFASYYGTIAIYDVKEESLEIVRDPESVSFCGSLDWHPDGDLLAAGLRFGERRIYTVSNGESRALPVASRDVGQGIGWSPNGQQLALSEGNYVRVFDQNWTPVIELHGHQSAILDVAWLNEIALVTASEDHTIRVWDVQSGEQTFKISAHSTGIHGLQLDRPRRIAYSYSSDFAEVRQIQLRPVLPCAEKQISPSVRIAVKNLAWSPDGSQLAAVGSSQGRSCNATWTAAGNTAIASQAVIDSRSVAWLEDSSRWYRFDTTNKLCIDDPSNGLPITASMAITDGDEILVTNDSVGFLSRDRRLLLQASDNGLEIRNTKSLNSIAKISRYVATPSSVCAVWSPDDKLVLFGGWGHPNLVSAGGKMNARPSDLVEEPCRAVAWHPSGKMFALGLRSGAICFFDTSNQKLLRRVLGHQGEIVGSDFSPDGRRLATASVDRSVVIWDTASGDELLRFSLEEASSLGSLAWSPDGRDLAVATGNGIYVWSVADDLNPSGSRHFIESGQVYQELQMQMEAESWAAEIPLATWKPWYRELQALSKVLSRNETQTLEHSLAELFATAQESDWLAIKSAVRNWIEDQPNQQLSVQRAKEVLTALNGLNQTEVATRLVSIAVLRAKTRHLMASNLFDQAAEANAEAIERASNLVDQKDATAEHWRLWESVNVESAHLMARKLLNLTSDSDRDRWSQSLRSRVQEVENNLIRFPSWARLIAPDAGSQGSDTAWKSAIVDELVKTDLKAGRLALLIDLWAEQFNNPASYYDLYRKTLCYALQGDEQRYRETCSQMVKQFAESGDPSELGFTVWACSLLPDCLEDYEPVLQMAERLVSNSPEDVSARQYRAAVLYRAGKPEDARKLLMQLVGEKHGNSSPAYAWLFLALVEHDLGADKAAADWFQQADDFIDKQFRLEKQGKGDMLWNRRATLQLLRSQAQRKLESRHDFSRLSLCFGNVGSLKHKAVRKSERILFNTARHHFGSWHAARLDLKGKNRNIENRGVTLSLLDQLSLFDVQFGSHLVPR